MNTCLDSCEGEQCELIFTGASQAAGASTIGSIVFKDKNPKVITWGGARALYRISPEDNSLCQDVNPQNHYRLVLTDRVGLIDFIPYQWAFFAEHVGHEIFFDQEYFNYLGINNRIKRNPLRYNLAVHSPCQYVHKARDIYQNVCFPAPAYGWLDGHWCAVDDDCGSRLCYRGKCFAGKDVEERCSRHEECISKICNENIGRCAMADGTMAEGMRCAEDIDCETGRCDPSSWLPLSRATCQVQLEAGEKCNEDSDCDAGYCGGWGWRKRCWPMD